MENSMTPDIPFMEGFERRMQFLAIAAGIIRRTGRDMELEGFFENQEMDSLIMAVLVFAMEETLSENRDCTLERISQFIDSLLMNVKANFPQDRIHDLTEYIVKTVLKNDGEPRYYTLLHPEKGFQKVRVEFLADTKEETANTFRIHYQLTDQAYEFLFRTKEVDSELRFTMEELKLRELIRRKNYGKAIRQSSSLIQMIRQKKRELQQFIDRVRDNVLIIDVGEFETLYRSTFELLTDEYGVMREIRSMLLLAYEHLQHEISIRDTLDREMSKALSDMERIRRNLDLAVAEQQAMIVERHSVSELYGKIMNDAFSRRILNRFDMQGEILKPIMKMNTSNMNKVFKILNPLFLPNLPKWLSISTAYQPQQKLRLADEVVAGIVFNGLEEDFEAERIQASNQYYIAFIDGLLEYASLHHSGFRLKEFILWITEERLKGLNKSHLDRSNLFQTVMKLFEAGMINISAWKKERPEVAENAAGEFDLEYCLYCLEHTKPDLYGISQIQLQWQDKELFETKTQMESSGAIFESTITVSNIQFYVVFDSEQLD